MKTNDKDENLAESEISTPSTNLQTADDFSVHGVSGPGESDWGVQQPSVHSVSQPQSHSSEPSTILLPHIAFKFAESDGKVWCVYILHFKKNP